VAARRMSIALFAVGALLAAYSIVTVAWQDPVTGVIAAREQARLRADLDAEIRRALSEAGAATELLDPRSRGRRAAVAMRRRLSSGDAVGRLELPTLERSFVVGHHEDVQVALEGGPAHYPDSPLPGEGATTGIAGHRTTYGAPFRMVHRLRRGDALILTMPYGEFRYSVEKVFSVRPTETWVKRAVGRERLLLSASHPPYSAARRLIVFARLDRARWPRAQRPSTLGVSPTR
jgi:sortase A